MDRHVTPPSPHSRLDVDVALGEILHFLTTDERLPGRTRKAVQFLHGLREQMVHHDTQVGVQSAYSGGLVLPSPRVPSRSRYSPPLFSPRVFLAPAPQMVRGVRYQ